jgi:hypothetical protein
MWIVSIDSPASTVPGPGSNDAARMFGFDPRGDNVVTKTSTSVPILENIEQDYG